MFKTLAVPDEVWAAIGPDAWWHAVAGIETSVVNEARSDRVLVRVEGIRSACGETFPPAELRSKPDRERCPSCVILARLRAERAAVPVGRQKDDIDG